jgi:hypothetical protein
MLRTKRELKIQSSPAQHPQYTMTVPRGTRCELVDGCPVVADTSKVIGGNTHDLVHYYIWIPAGSVEDDGAS